MYIRIVPDQVCSELLSALQFGVCFAYFRRKPCNIWEPGKRRNGMSVPANNTPAWTRCGEDDLLSLFL